MSTITAAIDIGTNSFRLLIASCAQEKQLRILVKRTETVRLGQQLDKDGALQEAAITRGITALQTFAKLLADFEPEKIRVCGTAALRNATNSSAFCDLAHQQLGTRIEIINAEEEALLSLQGSVAGLSKQNKPILMIDSGGGSTEIIYRTTPRQPTQTKSSSFFTSIPIGAVNLTEKFFKADLAAPDIKPLANFLSKTYKTQLHNLCLLTKGNDYIIVASGGTATSLAALDLNLTTYDENAVQGHIITKNTLAAMVNTLHSLPSRKRCELPPLDQGRGEIILAGAMIYLALFNSLKAEQITISDWGLLEGILLSAYSQL